jgi:hypothetical protein
LKQLVFVKSRRKTTKARIRIRTFVVDAHRARISVRFINQFIIVTEGLVPPVLPVLSEAEVSLSK